MRFEHDTAGRLVETERDLWVEGVHQGVVTTTQVFDQEGRVVAQGDPAGNATTYMHDVRGRLRETHMPDGKVYALVLDPYGNVTRTRDPNGNEVESRWDALGRRTRRDTIVEDATATPPLEAEVFVHDGLGRLTWHGRESGAGRSVELRHDSRGNVLTETAREDGDVAFIAQHVHAADGFREASCWVASGAQVRRVRDALGRLKQVYLLETWTPTMPCGEPHADERLVIAQEHAGPRIMRRAYGNGIVMTIGRDEDLRRSEDVVQRFLPNGVVEDVYRRQYVRNEVHDRIFFGKSEAREPSRHEVHDSLHRLIRSEVEGGEIVEYDLDDAGNREQVQRDGVPSYYSMTGREQLNQYYGGDNLFLGYDANGNVLARVPEAGDPRTAVRFWMDALNRPSVAMVGSAAPWDRVAEFTYDALHRRAGKRVREGATTVSHSWSFHDGEMLVEERDRLTGDVTLRVYGGWGLDDLVLQVTEGERTWVTTDSQSSVIKAFDDEGELLEQFRYDDYGMPWRGTELDGEFERATGSSRGLSQLFTGAWYDWEIGLYWLRTRFMDPELGRFMARDPAGIWADAAALGNGYTYAANNPGTMVDPLGLQAAPDTRISDRSFLTSQSPRNWDGVTTEAPMTHAEKLRRAGGGDPVGEVAATSETANTNEVVVLVREGASGAIEWLALDATESVTFLLQLTEHMHGMTVTVDQEAINERRGDLLYGHQPAGCGMSAAKPSASEAEAANARRTAITILVILGTLNKGDDASAVFRIAQQQSDNLLTQARGKLASVLMKVHDKLRAVATSGGGKAAAEGAEVATSGALNPKIYTQLEKQLAKDGPETIHTALRSAERTLKAHQEKLPSLEHKSQVEKTIWNVENQIATLKQFIKDKGL